jgi:hypothetical protein
VYWWGWAQVSSFQYSSFGLEWLDVMCCYPITSLRIPCLQHLSYLGISCNEKLIHGAINPNQSSQSLQFLLPRWNLVSTLAWRDNATDQEITNGLQECRLLCSYWASIQHAESWNSYHIFVWRGTLKFFIMRLD